MSALTNRIYRNNLKTGIFVFSYSVLILIFSKILNDEMAILVCSLALLAVYLMRKIGPFRYLAPMLLPSLFLCFLIGPFYLIENYSYQFFPTFIPILILALLVFSIANVVYFVLIKD